MHTPEARTPRRRRTWLAAGMLSTLTAVGCNGLNVDSTANIRNPVALAELQPPSNLVAKLPEAPKESIDKQPKLTTPTASGPLRIENILDSVQSSFPLVYAIEQERAIALGQLTTAESAFDPILRSRFQNQNGSFPSRIFDVNIEQPTPWNGASFIAGYRTGFNDFPSYSGGSLTADGGEFRVGAAIPLLRGAEIDPARARIRAAQITTQLADPAIRQARLGYFLNASNAYWNWVQAGATYEVRKEILKLAEDRQADLERQLKVNAVIAVTVTENRRQIAERKAELIRAQAVLDIAALSLSLFYRNESGDRIVPMANQLPGQFIDETVPELDQSESRIAADLAGARMNRPELQRFQLLRQRLGVDLKLALNDFYPRLNAFGFGAQDVGGSKSGLDRSNAQLGVNFELPVPRRDALGRRSIAESQIVQTLYNEKDALDRVFIEVKSALALMANSAKTVNDSRTAYKEALEAQDLDETRFKNNGIDAIVLNLRELTTAQSKLALISALADYYRATALYYAALGLEGRQPSTATPPPVSGP
jgi:outer membrane protein, heavy metal efflux system